MKQPHILLASSNVRRLQVNLAHILDVTAKDAISREIEGNVRQLFRLGKNHYLFARRQNNRNWRQKISRLYYAAYNVSRAIRLAANGEYSTESSDHKKIEKLPDAFPNRNTYENQLGTLRDDRNLCDYDHTGAINDLINTPDEALQLVEDLLRDSEAYLSLQGITL